MGGDAGAPPIRREPGAAEGGVGSQGALAAKRPAWRPGDEGRFIFDCCAAEAAPVRLGLFRCPACGKTAGAEGSDVKEGPLHMIATDPRWWDRLSVGDICARARVNPNLGVG